jgi:hypothetical protein
MAISLIGYWLKNTVESQEASGPKQFIAVQDHKGRRLYKIRGNEPLPGPKVKNLSSRGQPLAGGRVPFGSFRFVLDLSAVRGWGVRSKWLFIIEDNRGKTILDTDEDDQHTWNFAEMDGRFTFRGTAHQITDLGKTVAELSGGEGVSGLDALNLILNPGGE